MSAPEGPNERFERLAEEFYRETGIFAPGKSQPVEWGETHPEKERWDAWDKWVKKQRDVVE